MTILSPDDVAAAIAGLHFDAPGESANELSETQVTTLVTDLERDLAARVAAHGYAWPATGTDAANALRAGLLVGARAAVLATLYALSDSQTAPAGVEGAARAYRDWLDRLPELLRGLMAESPRTAGSAVPRAVRPRHTPRDWQSFEDFTLRQDPASSRVLPPWWPR